MAGKQFDEFTRPGWNEWKHFEMVTIRQAACLLSFVDPLVDASNSRWIVTEAKAKRELLLQAVKLGRIRAKNLFIHDWNGGVFRTKDLANLDVGDLSDSTEVMTSELAAWCDTKAFLHPWVGQIALALGCQTFGSYPPELRAAIEAFDAVHSDPCATAGKSPKKALEEWLRVNKPDLSAGARERIATVANWQREGGAPKTPG
jgi:hypothetical protein